MEANYHIVVVFAIHWHESAMDSHVLPIPIPPPTSLSTCSLEVFPVHQVRVLVSCIQPGLVICFTLDNIHVSMLFFWNIPPSPSPTESKRLFYKSVSSFFFFFNLWWILSYIEMKQPRVYMCSPSQSPLSPPSPSIPSRFSQCTRSECLTHASNLGWWSLLP